MPRFLILSTAVLALVSCSDDIGRRPAELPADQPVEIARADSGLISIDDSAVAEVHPEEEQTAPRAPAPRERSAPPRAPVAPPDPRPAEPAPLDTQPPAPSPAPADTATSTATIDPDTAPAAPDSVPAAPEPMPPPRPEPPIRSPDTIGTARPIPARVPPVTVPEPTSDGGGTATVTIPVGTELHASLVDSIHSRHDSAGETVTAKIMDNVLGPDGRTVVPAGATVRLTIVRLAPAKSRGAEDGEIALRVEGLNRGPDTLPVTAEVRPVPHELRGRGVTGSEAAKVGAGAAAGAIAGRVLGGGTRGAVIGGVVGAAGGAAVAAETADRDVVVKAGTPISFVLTAPLVAIRP